CRTSPAPKPTCCGPWSGAAGATRPASRPWRFPTPRSACSDPRARPCTGSTAGSSASSSTCSRATSTVTRRRCAPTAPRAPRAGRA
ncbi:MAG: hypothetical protein AVDCRST_MAG51-2728, partial [uncultured Ramlibacter sp.]